MKKLFAFLCATGLIFCLASPAAAGGIDNKTNWSAEYIRTFNRNAATDAADIVLYNPAGTVKMEDGFYANLSGHYIIKDYSNIIDNVDKEGEDPSFIPGVFALYKKNDWSYYFGMSNFGGGGKITFENGSQTTNKLGYALRSAIPVPGATIVDERSSAESYYLGYTFGGAYKINNMFAVSLAARYIDAYREAQVEATHRSIIGDRIENAAYDESADGWTGIIGVNISPTAEFNIGIRYETNTDLNFKQTVSKDTLNLLAVPAIARGFGVSNGAIISRDLPAILGAGASYQISPKIRMETNLTWYFNTDADWDGREENVDDGYDLGIMFEYAFSESFKATLGYLYTETGIEAKDMTPEAPELDANTIGGGVAWKAMKALTLNFAVGNSFYTSESFTYVPSPGASDKVEYEKNNLFIGFGLEYKFM